MSWSGMVAGFARRGNGGAEALVSARCSGSRYSTPSAPFEPVHLVPTVDCTTIWACDSERNAVLEDDHSAPSRQRTGRTPRRDSSGGLGKRETLAFLEESEENNASYYWDAMDSDGRSYTVYYRYGHLSVGTSDVLVIDRQIGEEYDSYMTREMLLEHLADVFDVSLLDRGTHCRCGFVYEPDEVPLQCIRCSEEVRVRKIVSISDAGDEPPLPPEHSDGKVVKSWRCLDEADRTLWIVWFERRLVIAGDGAERDDLDTWPILCDERAAFPHGSDRHVLSHLRVEVAGHLDLSPVECTYCLWILLDVDNECPACGTARETDNSDNLTLGILCHAVHVRWNDGSRETFRYATEAQALRAAEYQNIDNWLNVRSALYVGRRINWRFFLGYG